MYNQMATNNQHQQKYVDLMSDAGFKIVYGDRRNTALLKQLLNTFLPDEKQVSDLTIINTELQGFTLENKSVRLDLRCTDADGREFIIEVQRAPHKCFFKRIISYFSAAYLSHVNSGDKFFQSAVPIYSMVFVNNPMLEPELQSHKLVSHFRLYDGEVYAPDEINIIFVRVNNACGNWEECRTDGDKLSYLLRHISEFEDFPETMRGCGYEDLFTEAEIARFNPSKKNEYYNIMTTEWDLQLQKEEMFEKGQEIGREKGKSEEKIKIARGMLAKGIDTALICELTGLSESELLNSR